MYGQRSRWNDRPPREERSDKFRVKQLVVDFNENLLQKVADIARRRNVSLYGQIRDFVEKGVRDHEQDLLTEYGDDGASIFPERNTAAAAAGKEW